MLRSLYSGISGMKANQVKLDVIGNNIANVGTTAFKGSRVRFQDMVSQSMSQALAPGTNQGGVNPRQVGLGVQVAGIDTLVSQGMMQPTSRNLDVAMDGEGYLMVAKGLVPVGTAETSIPADSTAVAIAEAAALTAESAAAVEVVDRVGVQLNPDYTVNGTSGLSLSYTRDGALTLDNEGNLLNSDGLRVLGYAVSDGKNISLDYDKNGKPIQTYADADSKNITTNPKLIPLVIPEKIYVPAVAEIPGPPVIPASLATTSRIRTFSIEKDGMIKAVLDSGKVAVLGQIAVASFKNPAGLSKVGGNIYANTSNSGAAVVRTGKGAVTSESTNAAPVFASGNGQGYGDMLQGMLEMSNVDLAEQFTDMIVASRAFQAAGKTITTGDEILQDIINLKR